MTSDAEDALSWEGDEQRPESAPALPRGWNAVGKGSDEVGTVEEDGTVTPPAPTAQLSTTMLVLTGVFGGIYLLYTVGWLIGGLNLKPSANVIVADAMYLPWLVLGVAAPALWMLTVWVLTRARASWIRILLLLAGVVLLVPWPFVMTGALG